MGCGLTRVRVGIGAKAVPGSTASIASSRPTGTRLGTHVYKTLSERQHIMKVKQRYIYCNYLVLSWISCR